jgi:hypothetical protein
MMRASHASSQKSDYIDIARPLAAIQFRIKKDLKKGE